MFCFAPCRTFCLTFFTFAPVHRGGGHAWNHYDLDAGVDFSVGGKDPSFLVGGIAETWQQLCPRQGKHLSSKATSTAFFDKGEVSALPLIGHFASVEFDHADIYADLDAVKLAFRGW